MVGMLEALLSGGGFGGPNMSYTVPEPPLDESAIVQAAAEAAAKRQKRAVISEPPAFNAPAVPFSGMGMLGAGGAVPQFDPASLPPDTNDPMAVQPEAFKGGVPIPRPRPADLGGAVDEMGSQAQQPGAPMSLAPPMAQPQAQPQPVAPGGGFGSGILSKIDSFLKPENAPLLFSLAGGFAGAPSVGTGMRRAFSQAAPAAMQSIQLSTKLGGQSATYKALIAKGVPAQEALAATLNPDVMKAVAAKYFEAKPLQHVMAKGPLGEDIPLSYDQNKGVYLGADGKPLNQGSGSEGTSLGASNVYAPGVTKIDPNLSGDEMLAQYHPDVQAAAKAYMNGDVMPSGNPRMKSIGDLAKRIAVRYGQDTGIPVSDATFSEKRKYRQELGSNSANSAGGQAKAFNQGVEHATALADKIEKLGNYDPLGIPLVASTINAGRQAMSTTQASKAGEVNAIGQTLAGEVGKLFSGSAGGGVHERDLTRQRFNSVKSNKELAGALEATLETMEGGLRALEQRRDSVLGPNNNVQLIDQKTQANMAKIREVISRLKGETTAPAAAPAGKTGSGINWSVVQ